MGSIKFFSIMAFVFYIERFPASYLLDQTPRPLMILVNNVYSDKNFSMQIVNTC